jgi:hypothetical protein
MAEEATARGFRTRIGEPFPGSPDQWSMIAEVNQVASPAVIRDNTDFFEDLATRHGAEYDGWEASV